MIKIKVDVLNPGQFFACCGLLELSHRLWPGVEGHFSKCGSGYFFVIEPPPRGESNDVDLRCLLNKLCNCKVSGLTEEEQKERSELEKKRSELEKKRKELSELEENRRKELGEKAREGTLHLGEPFKLTLDWWQSEDEKATLKTWAGRQEIHKIARAAQDALKALLCNGKIDLCELLNHGCILRTPAEYAQKDRDQAKPVEPFCFDTRRYVHALKVGFSLDAQNTDILAYPAVELLALIGIQRFRLLPSGQKWSFEYVIWLRPLGVPVAAAVASGVIPFVSSERYLFRFVFRDDQKRYKAFGRATKISN
ncbi:MAG: type I-U CRISPR-associated protein Cas8c [Pyrinomonadaceae bacterium]|jgi:CRISPR-associated protein Csb3|nr:MAG: type I-U CRISPR-associated protein Cas8c [Pyrinomonadaceae bacterium]